MTIIEAITRADALKPNQYSQEEKVRWLYILDAMVYKEVIETHADPEITEAPAYTTETPLSAVLLIAEPYAQEVYVAWLHAQTDYYNEELGRYGNDMAAFNSAYSNYTAWYNRTHMPLQENSITTFSSAKKRRPAIFDAVRINGADYLLSEVITESPLEN